ncbi:MAG TPA: hypothetical protein VFG46_07565 [Chryseolinea sp.]|nr:hypothetical protein [Chryseolinea sp.]
MYSLSPLDMQILEVVSQKDFSTIWDVHAQLNSYNIILVMRAMHTLRKEGYLRQEFRGTLTLYYLKRKTNVFGEFKVKGNFRPR